jgi:hypothetical protein
MFFRVLKMFFCVLKMFFCVLKMFFCVLIIMFFRVLKMFFRIALRQYDAVVSSPAPTPLRPRGPLSILQMPLELWKETGPLLGPGRESEATSVLILAPSTLRRVVQRGVSQS